MRAFLVLLFLIPAGSTWAEGSTETDRVQVLAVIDEWYAELAMREDGRPDLLMAPGAIDASPHYDYIDTGSAALGPRYYTSLAATGLQFAYEVRDVRLDPSFAKVRVWERGYFYAAAAETTYETAASTLFILERDAATGRWLVLAHQSNSEGIPSTMATDPMPDLREAWERQQSEAAAESITPSL